MKERNSQGIIERLSGSDCLLGWFIGWWLADTYLRKYDYINSCVFLMCLYIVHFNHGSLPFSSWSLYQILPMSTRALIEGLCCCFFPYPHLPPRLYRRVFEMSCETTKSTKLFRPSLCMLIALFVRGRGFTLPVTPSTFWWPHVHVHLWVWRLFKIAGVFFFALEAW